MLNLDKTETTRKGRLVMDLDDWLDFVSNDDDLGLLKTKPIASAPTADEHLLAKFSEINDFFLANGREPESDMTNVPEFMLSERLSAIRANAEQCSALRELDVHNLLPDDQIPEVTEPEPESIEINSLDDIFSDDSLGLLNDSEDSIFKINHVPKERASPEHVSRRKKCKEFEQFKPIFSTYHAGLKSGALKRIKFKSELQLQTGEMFVVDGVLVYIANIGAKQKKNFGNVNARLYCVFDNGTESNMYLRSLAAAMWKDPTSGQIVDANQPDFVDEASRITEDDQPTGYIYILKSLSTNPDISSVKDLYKIGYSTTSVEKRIANAANEPTYLMAPVHHIASYGCFNMNAQKFENLLHTFFGKACLDIEVADSEGKTCKPREWFVAPLEAIEHAIRLMISGEVVGYRFDLASSQVVAREN